jgi:uncharacterized protein (DUF433 family)
MMSRGKHDPATESVIQVSPDILGGTAVFRGTRVPISTLFDYLAAGDTVERFLDHFPTVKHDQVVALLEEVKINLTPLLNEHPARRVCTSPACSISCSGYIGCTESD